MRKVLPILTLILFALALFVPLSQPQSVESQTATEAPTTDMDAKTDDLFNGFGRADVLDDVGIRCADVNQLPAGCVNKSAVRNMTSPEFHVLTETTNID